MGPSVSTVEEKTSYSLQTDEINANLLIAVHQEHCSITTETSEKSHSLWWSPNDIITLVEIYRAISFTHLPNLETDPKWLEYQYQSTDTSCRSPGNFCVYRILST